MQEEARKRAATQADIAIAAGVSTATVSRVLNGSPLVRDSVRERVEAAMRQLGYLPHGAARALASNRSFTVGAAIPTLNNAIFAQGVNALERALQTAGYTLLLAISNYDPAVEALQIRRLIERGVDGLFLIGNAHTAETYETLRRAGLPAVNTWAYAPDVDGLPNIGFDNRVAAAAIVDHLVALGHRRIAMVAGVTAANDRAAERVAGVRAALARHGLAPARIVERRYGIADGRAALATLLAEACDATAIVCGNDVIALGVLFEAQARGIAVPGALSITGFDNLPLTEHVVPGLTTIDVPARAMGERAAAALLKAIDGHPIVGDRLDAPLLVRGTTGVPAS